MKILDRYIITSILKIAFFAILVFALILAGVELFSKIDSLITGSVPLPKVIEYLLLSIPDYLMMGSSLALLFATTYFLSMLSANNERIALLNSGLSTFRLALPIICLSIVLTIIGIGYQEFVLNKLQFMHDELSNEIFGTSSTKDARNIVLKNEDGYLVYTRRFNESTLTIFDPVIIKTDTEQGMDLRLEAAKGIFKDGKWFVYDATIYEKKDNQVSSKYESEYTLEEMNIEPNFFKASNININTMDFSTAHDYLKKLKTMDKENWQQKATDYYRSLFEPLAIFVLMSVAATLNYHFKKNVLLFSIIQSLCIAVVYYVADMVFSIAAHQGAISPYLCVSLPVIVTIGVSIIFNKLGKLL